MSSAKKKKKYRIRRAKATDAFVLLGLMKDFLAEISSKYPDVCDADCLDWLLKTINRGGVWVAISDRKIVGSIGCGVDVFMWNRSCKNVYDEWFYVRPEFRKGYNIAKELIGVAKEAASNAGLPFIFSVNSGKDKKVDRFIEMQGFEYKGGIGVHWPTEGG